MAPFASSMTEVRQQIIVKESIDNTQPNESTYTMDAQVDPDWMVAVVPHGGYLIALVIQACNIVQRSTNQPDPLYVSTQFIGSSTPGCCVIKVKRIKVGRSYSNLVAELSQEGRDNIHCQLIYGVIPVSRHPFSPFPADPNYLTLAHPSALSRRCPIATHPSKCIATPFTRPFTFAKHLVHAVDPYYATVLESCGHGYAVTNPADLGGGGSVWGGWYQTRDEGDIASEALVAFLADVTPDFLPEILSKQRGPMWVPTLALTLDFKHRIPSPTNPAPGVAPRTFGVFLTSKFLIEGRHDITSEIWTAPCEIGQGIEEEGWQDRMFCIVSATHTALTVSPAANLRKAKGSQSKSAWKL